MTTIDTMKDLIERHIKAEMGADVDAAVAVYAPGVVHDVVGFPTGPAHGVDGARAFYDYLTSNFANEQMNVRWESFGDEFCVVEHECTGTVPGEFLGVPGGGKRITFRMLHVWEFADDRITREQVWLDGGSIVAQLTDAGH